MSSPFFRRAAAAVALAAAHAPLHAQNTAPTRLTLGDAARLAGDRSTAAEAARARSARADAQVSLHRADLLPSLSSSAQLGARTFNTASLGFDFPSAPGAPAPFDARGEVLGPARTVDVRAQIAQRVLDVPAILRWKAAGDDADAAHFAAVSAAHAAAERGAVAYVGALRAEARIAARAADSALAAELLDMARQQLRAGVAVALDVTRAESQLADAHARLIGARGDRDRAALELRRELALAHDAPLALDDCLSEPSGAELGDDVDAAVADALARRAETKAADAAADAARRQVRAARAERLPSVAVFADQGTSGARADRLSGTYSYGVQLSVPLFDGMRLESRASGQRAREREARAEASDTRLRVETEVRSAAVRVATAREQITATRARLRLAEREVAQARERFRAGLSGNGDVITASITLNGARDLDIDALAEYQAARVALARARGLVTAMP